MDERRDSRRSRRYGPMGPWWPPWDPRFRPPPEVVYPGYFPWNPFSPPMARQADEIAWLEDRLRDLEDERVEVERDIEDLRKELERRKRDTEKEPEKG